MAKTLASKLRPVPQEEVLAATTEYFKGDSLAAGVWMNKYAIKDSDGNFYESNPNEMHWRIAHEIARIEKKYAKENPLAKENALSAEEVYELIKDFKHIIPQGSPMAGIGNPMQKTSSLSNCFVIGNEGNSDSYGGIMKIDEEQVQLMKRRGGVGHDLSHIRPYGSEVKNSALTSTGIVPFMERYSNSTKEVAQEGRRGALMLTLDIRHPDAERFIDAKLEEGKINGANISVKINDDFMNAVKENRPYIQQYPVDSDNPTMTQEIDATKLWKKIIHNAWKSAEPGILFWDTITSESVPDRYAKFGFKTISTNPCGEIPLCPYDSCRLLAINLYNYVEDPFTENAKFNNDKFEDHAKKALRIMDDIVDLEAEKINNIIEKIDNDPEPEHIKARERRMWENILEKTLQGRRTGIGITAEGDMIAALGKRYASPEAIDISSEVHKQLAVSVYRASTDLAKERGAFPIYNFELEEGNPFLERLKEEDPDLFEDMKKNGRRNIAMLTVAPTGSVSICSQTSSGIEPAIMISYDRRRKVMNKNEDYDKEDKDGTKWKHYEVFHHNFETWMKVIGEDIERAKKLAYDSRHEKDEEKRKKAEEDFNEIFRRSPFYQATSKDVDWVGKVKMQGAVQKWVDHSISATTNVEKNVTEELVEEIYMAAWEAGCKGMTIYREGSREAIMVEKRKKEGGLERGAKFPEGRPATLPADVLRFKDANENGGEDWIAFIGKTEEGEPFEIFTGKPQGAMLYLPGQISEGKIKKFVEENGNSRYDFIYMNEVGAPNTIGGISHQFNREYWNYARLVSGHLREGTPVVNLIKIVEKLDEESEGINTWKRGVLRALRKYTKDGEEKGIICPECDMPVVFDDGCEKCGCGGKCD
jgi:ribonucleoside-diphosphate reductase alpha chain